MNKKTKRIIIIAVSVIGVVAVLVSCIFCAMTAALVIGIYNYRDYKSTETYTTADDAVLSVIDDCSVESENSYGYVFYSKDDKYAVYEINGGKLTSYHNYGTADSEIPFSFSDLMADVEEYVYNDYTTTYYEFRESELKNEDFHQNFDFENCRYFEIRVKEWKKGESVEIYENIFVVVSENEDGAILIIDQTDVDDQYYIAANGCMIDVAKEYVNTHSLTE